jgi:heme iron utilization protein
MSEINTELTKAEQKEIDSASKNANRFGDPAGDVRRWLLETSHATLCTLSAKPQWQGFPFGSLVPFTVDAQGRPIILIAEIAVHTANLRKDPKANLFISDPNNESGPQASWRVGIMGVMKRVIPEGKDSRYKDSAYIMPADDYQDIHSRYVERVPNAAAYIKQHDFSYWRMEEIHTARYIAGFGRICWIKGHELLRDPMQGGLDHAAQSAINHMNEDHHHNLIEMCEAFYDIKPSSVQMTTLDATGFHVKTSTPDHNLFFSFGQEITAESLKSSVIQVLHKARSITQEYTIST